MRNASVFPAYRSHGWAKAVVSNWRLRQLLLHWNLLLLLLLLLLLILPALKQTNARWWSAEFRATPVVIVVVVVVCFSCGGCACLSCWQWLLRVCVCAGAVLLMSVTMQQMRQTHILAAPTFLNIISVIYLLILLIYMQSVENFLADKSRMPSHRIRHSSSTH